MDELASGTRARAVAEAVIVAAGPSRRMRGIDKIWAPIAGRPLLAWTVAAFERATEIARIVLVVAPERLGAAEELRVREGWRRVALVVVGGPRRRDSVRLGLEALGEASAASEIVVVHDGARPLVTPALIRAGLAAARRTGAATASEPVKETIKRVHAGLVAETLPRAQLVRAQTPQVFERARLLAAHAAADPTTDFADDATLVCALGLPLAIFPGSHENLKATTPDDLPVVEALLRARGEEIFTTEDTEDTVRDRSKRVTPSAFSS